MPCQGEKVRHRSARTLNANRRRCIRFPAAKNGDLALSLLDLATSSLRFGLNLMFLEEGDLLVLEGLIRKIGPDDDSIKGIRLKWGLTMRGNITNK